MADEPDMISENDTMNKQRRETISKLISAFEELQPELETVASEERDAFDSMPESWQQSERGEQSSAAADALENAQSALEELLAELGEIEL